MTTKKKEVAFTLRQTLYGWNIYRNGRKIEGPYVMEIVAMHRIETLQEREVK